MKHLSFWKRLMMACMTGILALSVAAPAALAAAPGQGVKAAALPQTGETIAVWIVIAVVVVAAVAVVVLTLLKRRKSQHDDKDDK